MNPKYRPTVQVLNNLKVMSALKASLLIKNLNVDDYVVKAMACPLTSWRVTA